MILGNPTITNKRIEIKEVATEFDLTRILKAISLSTLSFRQSYPMRRINSLYFDDSFFSSVEESYEGNSIRSKKRMRWYGQSKEPVHATLEIKEKQGHLSWKKLYRNICKICPSSKIWKCFITYDNKNDFHLLSDLEPKSIVTYDRNYYCSFDRKVRITIDQNIRTYNQYLINKPNISKCNKIYNIVIIEIKLDSDNSFMLKKVLQDIPFTPVRFSKYCESISRIH